MPEGQTAMPTEGKKAPAIALPASSGEQVKLSDFKGQPVVLYFYPRDDTPGCTVEAGAFRDARTELDDFGAVVLGVSTDSVESHCKFISKHGLNFLLLADEKQKVVQKYGVWVGKNRYGRKYMGVQRATFLIDSKGKVAKVWPKVKPEGHAQDVIEALRAL